MVYLDNNATTRPNRNMLNSAQEEVATCFGNPSSSHYEGQSAKDSIEQARQNVAEALGVESSSIVFTSGGTEANNIAIFGSDLPLITTNVEHSSVYKCSPFYVVPVKEDGTLNIDKLKSIVSSIVSPCIVSVMLANNETGIILDPNDEILKLKDKYGFILHVDAVQGFGKILDYKIPEQVDMLSISGHKIHALKGVGALYIKDGIELTRPLVAGGTHEFGVRPGTENHIGIYSLGYMARKIANDSFYRSLIQQIDSKRDMLEVLLNDIAEPNGCTENRIGNTSNLYFPDVSDVELFVELLSSEGGICVSGGSACSSGIPEPSRVLTAMFGKSHPRTKGSIRISLSVDTTDADIHAAEQGIRKALKIYKEIEND